MAGMLRLLRAGHLENENASVSTGAFLVTLAVEHGSLISKCFQCGLRLEVCDGILD